MMLLLYIEKFSKVSFLRFIKFLGGSTMVNTEFTNGQEELNGAIQNYLQKNNLNLSNLNGQVDIQSLFQYITKIGLINESQYEDIIKIITT